MLIENHTVEINNRSFFCDVYIDANGCRPIALVEVLEDSTELQVTEYYKNRIQSMLNEQFYAETQQEKEKEIETAFIRSQANKDIKANKRTSFQGTHYQVTKETSSNAVALNRIDYNFLSLYFLEPVNIRQVYSDNFEQLLNIEKISNYYKIKLPDGNTTSYYYTNGVCSKVKVEQSLFTIEFVLTQNPS